MKRIASLDRQAPPGASPAREGGMHAHACRARPGAPEKDTATRRPDHADSRETEGVGKPDGPRRAATSPCTRPEVAGQSLTLRDRVGIGAGRCALCAANTDSTAAAPRDHADLSTPADPQGIRRGWVSRATHAEPPPCLAPSRGCRNKAAPRAAAWGAVQINPHPAPPMRPTPKPRPETTQTYPRPQTPRSRRGWVSRATHAAPAPCLAPSRGWRSKAAPRAAAWGAAQISPHPAPPMRPTPKPRPETTQTYPRPQTPRSRRGWVSRATHAAPAPCLAPSRGWRGKAAPRAAARGALRATHPAPSVARKSPPGRRLSC